MQAKNRQNSAKARNRNKKRKNSSTLLSLWKLLSASYSAYEGATMNCNQNRGSGSSSMALTKSSTSASSAIDVNTDDLPVCQVTAQSDTILQCGTEVAPRAVAPVVVSKKKEGHALVEEKG